MDWSNERESMGATFSSLMLPFGHQRVLVDIGGGRGRINNYNARNTAGWRIEWIYELIEWRTCTKQDATKGRTKRKV